ncbi:MAG TPA: tripartite tricarboxylate transporter substrate binding protein [Burkholderiales bacterium]
MKALFAISIAIFLTAPAQSQTYPSRPIRIIDAFAPGGITELCARAVGEKMSQSFGQPVIVENRPGGGGNIGVGAVARATPDGHTLAVVPSLFTTNISLFRNINWDPVRDFEPLTLVGRTPIFLVVNPTVLRAGSVKELIAFAKAEPGKLNYASGGIGATPHLAAELFKAMAGVDMTHIAYKGTAPAMTDLVAGQVHLSFSSPLTALPHVKSGRLRALGVTALERSKLMPDVPTIAEAGVPGYEVISWFGFLAPAGTPRPIVQKLHAEMAKSLSLPDVRERLGNVGLEIVASTPEQMRAFVKADIAKWAKVIRDARIPQVD